MWHVAGARWYVALGAVAVALAAGCAKRTPTPSYTDARDLPPYLQDPRLHPHPQCPPTRGLAGVGRSVDAPEQARDRAVASVAASVASRVESVLRDDSQLRSVNGAEQDVTVIEQSITQRAAFSHAELVRTVGGIERHGDEWFALACLDRVGAAKVLDEELAAPLQAFALALERAQAAASAKDPAAFATARAEADRAAVTALPLLAQRRAILDDVSASQRAHALGEAMATLRTLASAFRTALRVTLHLDAQGLDAGSAAAVGERVRSALARAGVQAPLVEAQGCGGEASHALTLRMERGCRWGSLGHTCAVSLALKGEDCAHGTGMFDSPFPVELKGSSTRSQEAATQRALKALDEDGALRGWLSPLLGGMASG